MSQTVVPEKGDHADHPGHTATDCQARMTVNAHRYGTSHNGYACLANGGHCLPSPKCSKREADYIKFMERHNHAD